MASVAPRLVINPDLNRTNLAESFASDRRLQIRNVLTDESARSISRVLLENTPWGISWQAGQDGPHKLRRDHLTALPPGEVEAVSRKLHTAMTGGEFAFIYSQYQMYDAMKDGWSGGLPHDAIVRDMNSAPFLDLVREISGIDQIKWCDAQATHYGPGQFLSLHQDINDTQDWLVAYVLNLCTAEWRPDWGGYLNFFDADGDVVAGYKPRFNALNIFLVPQDHSVGYVPSFAPCSRLAITGWFRGR